jgi:hypothetical protein
MAGVDSEAFDLAWLNSNKDKPLECWPVWILSTDSESSRIRWVKAPEDPKVYEELTVPLKALTPWSNVAQVVMTPVARCAYNALLKEDPTIEDVMATKKRVRNSTGFLFASPIDKTADRSKRKAGPSEKKVRNKRAPINQSAAKPSPAKPSPAKPSPAKPSHAKPSHAKKPKQVKCPSRSSFRPLILLAAATQEPAIIR